MLTRIKSGVELVSTNCYHLNDYSDSILYFGVAVFSLYLNSYNYPRIFRWCVNRVFVDMFLSLQLVKRFSLIDTLLFYYFLIGLWTLKLICHCVLAGTLFILYIKGIMVTFHCVWAFGIEFECKHFLNTFYYLIICSQLVYVMQSVWIRDIRN